jgi:hypothetical protein
VQEQGRKGQREAAMLDYCLELARRSMESQELAKRELKNDLHRKKEPVTRQAPLTSGVRLEGSSAREKNPTFERHAHITDQLQAVASQCSVRRSTLTPAPLGAHPRIRQDGRHPEHCPAVCRTSLRAGSSQQGVRRRDTDVLLQSVRHGPHGAARPLRGLLVALVGSV